MKKIIKLWFVIPIIIFASCGNPLGVEQNVLITTEANSYFPVQIGNYWIYQVDIDSLNYTDSLFVSGMKNIGDVPAYEIEVYRDGIFQNKTYFALDHSKILMFANLLEPLLDTIETPNGSLLEPHWHLIADFSNNSETKTDTVRDKGQLKSGLNTYPTPDSNSIIHEIDLNTVQDKNGIIEKNDRGEKIFQSVSLSLDWFIKSDSTIVADLRNSLDGIYVNDSTILYQKLNLSLQFKIGEGITGANGSISAAGRNFNQKRTLIRKKVNA